MSNAPCRKERKKMADLIFEERVKQEKHPLDIWSDLLEYAKQGINAIKREDVFRFKWFGFFHLGPKFNSFMVRIRVPGGQISSEQLKTIGELANDYGWGFGDITTRQNIQLRTLTIEQIPSVVKRLNDVGLSTLGAGADNVRNITGCPLAGMNPEELIDLTDTVKEMQKHLLEHRELFNLPRKFNIAISGCGTNCCYPEIHDIGVAAVRMKQTPGQIRFVLFVGGKPGHTPYFAKPLGVFVPREEIVSVCHHLLEIFRDHGCRNNRTRARMCFLIEDWGIEKFRQELFRRFGKEFEPATDYIPHQEQRVDHMGIGRQKQPGMSYIGVPIIVGRLSGFQMAGLAKLAQNLGNGTLRLTNKQNLLLPYLPEANLEKIKQELMTMGFQWEKIGLRAHTVACAGNTFCKFSLTETKNLAHQIIQHLETTVLVPEDFKINITGCPNSCAQHLISDIGLLGTTTRINGQRVEAWDVFAGGRLDEKKSFSRLIFETVPVSELNQTLEWILRTYHENKQAGEPFREFCARFSTEELKQLFSKEASYISA